MSSNNIKLMQGNEACVEGALYAGMEFYSGYPITPSTEIAEISALKLPKIGGKFIQMEDEIAGIAAAIGGSIAGLKSMTATSGPGFSLKQENLGYACIAEIPLVVVNVQRGGPSTGLPTAPSQGDVMQAKWGTHGDHAIIVLCPGSVYETFTQTVKAFNLAEKYRTPVVLLTDEVIAHMREKINIPAKGELEVIERAKPTASPEEYLPYELSDNTKVAPFAAFGSGYRYHITGLFHDETGFPSNSNENAQKMIDHMMGKINNNLDEILETEITNLESADILFVSYGSSARSAKSAIEYLKKDGINVAMFRPLTLWPFPEEDLKKACEKIKKIFVIEMNLGQIHSECLKILRNSEEVHLIGKANGEVITPKEIISRVKEELQNE